MIQDLLMALPAGPRCGHHSHCIHYRHHGHSRPLGGLPTANTGKTMRFTGTSVLKVENGLITEEIGLDDGVTVLRQLGLITGA